MGDDGNRGDANGLGKQGGGGSGGVLSPECGDRRTVLAVITVLLLAPLVSAKCGEGGGERAGGRSFAFVHLHCCNCTHRAAPAAAGCRASSGCRQSSAAPSGSPACGAPVLQASPGDHERLCAGRHSHPHLVHCHAAALPGGRIQRRPAAYALVRAGNPPVRAVLVVLLWGAPARTRAVAASTASQATLRAEPSLHRGWVCSAGCPSIHAANGTRLPAGGQSPGPSSQRALRALCRWWRCSPCSPSPSCARWRWAMRYVCCTPGSLTGSSAALMRACVKGQADTLDASHRPCFPPCFSSAPRRLACLIWHDCSMIVPAANMPSPPSRCVMYRTSGRARWTRSPSSPWRETLHVRFIIAAPLPTQGGRLDACMRATTLCHVMGPHA